MSVWLSVVISLSTYIYIYGYISTQLPIYIYIHLSINHTIHSHIYTGYDVKIYDLVAATGNVDTLRYIDAHRLDCCRYRV